MRSLDGDFQEDSLGKYQAVYLKLLEQQRKLLDKMNHSAEFDEELIRKYLSLIDLEEFKIREKQLSEAESTEFGP
jgi:CPA1 family monovalent cation:H+ antiporter